MTCFPLAHRSVWEQRIILQVCGEINCSVYHHLRATFYSSQSTTVYHQNHARVWYQAVGFFCCYCNSFLIVLSSFQTHMITLCACTYVSSAVYFALLTPVWIISALLSKRKRAREKKTGTESPSTNQCVKTCPCIWHV